MTAYVFRPMSDQEAREISWWSYDPPYDFYDATSDPDDLAELLDAERRREGSYYAARLSTNEARSWASSSSRGRAGSSK
jgi:hypothetical protein